MAETPVQDLKTSSPQALKITLPVEGMTCAACQANVKRALTANFREEISQRYPGIQVSLISPGLVHTDFGLNALHGGPDSRQLPDGQSAASVATIIAWMIESRRPDVYTREGAHDRVVGYYDKLGEDP